MSERDWSFITSECDNKWIDALSVYVGGELLPYYKLPNGSINATRTVDSLMQMLGVKKPTSEPMTAEQLRERVLGLIRQWVQNREVQQSTPAVMVLNALAGDVEVIDLRDPNVRLGSVATPADNRH